jgi:AraC-like DNA-binding protein
MGYIVVPRSVLHKGARMSNTGGVGEDDLALAKNFGYVDTLRSLLKTYLAEGYPSAQFAASLMDISVRTLPRRLSDHGLTYGSLIDDIRFSAAREMLQTPGVKIVDVASSVGFEDHSDFTRMFRSVGGLTPREFRQEF